MSNDKYKKAISKVRCQKSNFINHISYIKNVENVKMSKCPNVENVEMSKNFKIVRKVQISNDKCQILGNISRSCEISEDLVRSQ